MDRSISFTFNLIKTLSPSEKAYVKRKISSGGKHLVKLFDDLNKSIVYQKDDFIKKNQKKEYITNLSQNQNYLSKKIVSALINYRSKSIFIIEIHDQINEALILIEKKFYRKSRKIIDSCIEKALYIEDYATCFNLTRIIFNSVNNNVYFSLSSKEINEYKICRRFYLTQMNRIVLFDELNDIYYNSPPSEQLNAYKSKLKSLNVLDENLLSKEYPFTAKRVFYFSKAELAWLCNKLNKHVFFSKKIIDLYISDQKFVQLWFAEFLGDAVNYLNSLKRINDFNTFFEEHKRISKLIKANQKLSHSVDTSLIHVIDYFLPQTVYNNGRYFENSKKFADSYINFISKDRKKLSFHFIASSSCIISLAYLYNKFYNKTLEYLESALNSKNYNIQYAARLLQIITHYSLKNNLLLDHLFQSFYNYLKSVDKKEQIPNTRKLRKYTKNNTVHLLKNEDFEDFVYIHWDLFKK